MAFTLTENKFVASKTPQCHVIPVWHISNVRNQHVLEQLA